jgi:hypothetical protein
MLTPDGFLRHARIRAGSARFAVGAFERNVTLFRQQVRALNLIYSLAESTSGVEPGGRIAVIGGGAFGVTAAAAAASIGYEVRLYERYQELMPHQRGCDTRWINPRYYEWPSAGSASRYADLPLMAWESGTADEVADQLGRSLDAIRKRTGRLKVRLRTRNLTITPAEGGSLDVTARYSSGTDDWRCAAVVYAVGFGIERAVGDAPSYWRNDNFEQIRVGGSTGGRRGYVVSGVGDGALTDLARLTISRFRHRRIFEEVFGDLPDALLGKLREIRETSPGPENDWLARQFEALDDDLKKVRARIKSRRRRDTHVELVGHRPFREALSLEKVSLSNALLAWTLRGLSAFEYRVGTLEGSDHAFTVVNGFVTEALDTQTTVIARHGTDRDQAYRDAGLATDLSRLRKRTLRPETGLPMYPGGWWGLNAKPNGQSDPTDPEPTEFVPPAMVTLGTTFVSTLANVVDEQFSPRSQPDQDGLFRLTLHRIVRLGDRDLFQQVSPYRGRLATNQRSRGGVGRVFPVDAGVGGLAIRLGAPVLFRRDAGSIEQMKALTNFTELEARPIEEHVNSIFACPFFSAADDRVLFLLFADSSAPDFFDDEVLRTLFAACRGFVTNLDQALYVGDLEQARGINSGHLPSPSARPKDELLMAAERT